MKKEKNSVDDLFREVLRGHEINPSERTKEIFLHEASELKEEKGSRRGLLPYLLLAAFIIAGSIVVYLLLEQTDGTDNTAVKKVSENILPEQKTSLQTPAFPAKPVIRNTVNASVTKTGQPSSSSTDQKTTKPQNNESPDNTALKAPEAREDLTKMSVATIGPDEKSVRSLSLPPGNTQRSVTDSISVSRATDTVKISQTAFDDSTTTSRPETASVPGQDKKQREDRDWHFSTGVQYTAEWMFNTLENVKYVNDFGIEGIFTYGRYSVRTGLGLSITKGTNEIAVEYNDYLGSYNKLDSMSFSWNGAAHDFLPTYYMKNQDVYDSLLKLDQLKVMKRYTYLQVPLVFGYDFIRSGRFSAGFRAGPLISILLTSKQLSEEYDPGQKKVISINNITPEQVSLNWQFMAGINASVGLSRTLRFEMEPMAKYYFNSVYEKSEITEKPWSIGIRAAFIIKL